MSDDVYGPVILGGDAITRSTEIVIVPTATDDLSKTTWLGAWWYNPITGEEVYVDLRDYANGNPNLW